MDTPVFRKQVSMFLPLSDWQAIRQEAARRRMSMAALCREWIKPRMDSLRKRSPDDTTETNRDE